MSNLTVGSFGGFHVCSDIYHPQADIVHALSAHYNIDIFTDALTLFWRALKPLLKIFHHDFATEILRCGFGAQRVLAAINIEKRVLRFNAGFRRYVFHKCCFGLSDMCRKLILQSALGGVCAWPHLV